MNRLHVLLPSRDRAGLGEATRRRLARADHRDDGKVGFTAVLGEFFSWPGTRLPAAALTRQHAVGDAGQDVWLCADPAWMQADINGARMMACGNLGLEAEEAEAFAKPLRPLLGDAGAPLEITHPDHWHLRLAADAPVPSFAAPDEVLGADLLAALETGQDLRGWQRLLNDIQTELHQNPLRKQRQAAGKTPFNALWLWGGGALPAWVKSSLARVASEDVLLRALAARAGVEILQPAAIGDVDLQGDNLLDLGREPLRQEVWSDLLGLLDRRRVDALQLHFADGNRCQLQRAHRWRFWRRHS